MIGLANTLREIHRKDISLKFSKGSLTCDAPSGTMTDDLKAAIRVHKQALIEAVTGQRTWGRVTGRLYFTTIARCGECGYACWGPSADDLNTWVCQVCTDT